MEVKIEGNCRLINKSIMDANIPEEILIAMIKRRLNNYSQGHL